MTHSMQRVQPRCAANDTPSGPAAIPDLPLVSLVDLLAESYVAKMTAANDDVAPRTEN